MTIPEYMNYVLHHYKEMFDTLRQKEKLTHEEFLVIYHQLQEDKSYLDQKQYQLLCKELQRICYSDCVIYNVK